MKSRVTRVNMDMPSRWILCAGVWAVALVLAACSRTLVPLPTSTVAIAPIASLTPTPTETAAPAPTVTPQVGPVNAPADLAFVDPLHGWLLGAACDPQGDCPLAMRKSVDGGRSWTVAAAPAGILGGGDPSALGARRLTFASLRDGWAYDPSLFATHDAGKTWKLVGLPGEVISVKVGADNAWAVARICSAAGNCSIQVYSSPAGQDSWTPLAPQPPIAGEEVILLRQGPMNAWLLTWSAMAPTSGELASTHDGGATWQTLTDPTSVRMCSIKVLAAADALHPWLLCGGEGATIMMDKALFASADGGAHWTVIAEAVPPGSTGSNNLPLTGHVADLAVPGPLEAFIALGRSTLLGSVDGGKTWSDSIPLEPDLEGDVGVERVLFVDLQHGWALSGSSTLFRTEDGGQHWTSILIR